MPHRARTFGPWLLACWATASHAQLVQNTGSDPAFLEFARKLETTLTAGDTTFVQQSLDVDAVLDSAMKGIDAAPATREAFRRGVKGSLDFGAQLGAALKHGGSYRFLRLRTGAGGRTQALFRMLNDGGGVNYHEFALRREPSGRVRAVDLYIFLSGDWWSQTFRRVWLAVAGGGTGLNRLVQGESAFLKNLDQIRAMQKLDKEGQYAQAHAAWLKLPLELHSDKNLLIERVQIAMHLSEREYADAVDTFFKYHPSDAALDILLIDSYFNKQQWDLGLASVARLDRAVGGDAHLDFLRGNFHYSKKDFPAAKRALGEAIAAEPTLVSPYWTLVTIALEEQDFAETARLLTQLEKERSVAIGDLKDAELYAQFRKSDAYRKWMKSR